MIRPQHLCGHIKMIKTGPSSILDWHVNYFSCVEKLLIAKSFFFSSNIVRTLWWDDNQMVSVFMLDHMLSWIVIVLVHLDNNPHVVSPWGDTSSWSINNLFHVACLTHKTTHTKSMVWPDWDREYCHSHAIWSIQKEITT